MVKSECPPECRYLTEQAADLIEEKALELRAELDEELLALKAAGAAPAETEGVVDSVLTIIGGTAPKGGPGGGQRSAGSSEVAEVVMYLAPFYERGQISSALIRDRWREKVGTIADAIELNFQSDAFSAGDAINFRLEGRNEDNLKIVSTQLREELMRYPGVFDVSDSFRAGNRRFRFKFWIAVRPSG